MVRNKQRDEDAKDQEGGEAQSLGMRLVRVDLFG